MSKEKGSNCKLTRRERLLFKNLADSPGISIGEAARKAGYAESTVRSTIYTRLQAKASLNTGIKEIMDAQGLTDEKLVEKISEGLDAMKVLSEKGGLTETDIPDYSIRAKYLELAAKWKGLEKNLKVDVQSSNLSLQQILNNLPEFTEDDIPLEINLPE